VTGKFIAVEYEDNPPHWHAPEKRSATEQIAVERTAIQL